MKTVILAGGKGTRLSEYTKKIPKPMVSIGSRPIIWHIMNYYSNWGIKNFIVALGYKGNIIKEYYYNYSRLNSNLNINLSSGDIQYIDSSNIDWEISLINTGLETATGGRIKKIGKYLKSDENFMITYGDGLSNINIKELLDSHIKQKKLLTISAVHPPARFGELSISEDNLLRKFEEKPQMQNGWINGGFFVANKKIIDYVNDDDEMFEREPIQRLINKKEVNVYKHHGFWKCMDNVRDRDQLTKIWDSGKAPWK